MGYDSLGRRFAADVDVTELDDKEEFERHLKEFVNYESWRGSGRQTNFRSMADKVFDSPAVINEFRGRDNLEKWKQIKKQTGLSDRELEKIRTVEKQLERREEEKHGDEWTESERKYLEANYGYEDTKVLADKLGRTRDAVYSKAEDLDVSAKERDAKNWSKAEEKMLKENYDDYTANEIGEHLNRSETAVYNKVYRMRKQGEWEDDG